MDLTVPSKYSLTLSMADLLGKGLKRLDSMPNVQKAVIRFEKCVTVSQG
jgi:hypothetical protein